MVERGTGSRKVVIIPVATRDADTLLRIIREWILPGTTIYSDGWAAYGGINGMMEQGQRLYQHDWVNHSYNFINPGLETSSFF